MPKSLKHEHRFYRIFTNRFGAVEQCECMQYQTLMRDLNTKEIVAIPGNFLAILAGQQRLFVLTGTREEYEEVIDSISNYTNIKPENIIFLEHESQLQGMQPLEPIYFWGNWRENDVCSSVAFLKIMNGWI